MTSQHWFSLCLGDLSQFWPRSMSPYGVTRPQWVKIQSPRIQPWSRKTLRLSGQYLEQMVRIEHTISGPYWNKSKAAFNLCSVDNKLDYPIRPLLFVYICVYFYVVTGPHINQPLTDDLSCINMFWWKLVEKQSVNIVNIPWNALYVLCLCLIIQSSLHFYWSGRFSLYHV